MTKGIGDPGPWNSLFETPWWLEAVAPGSWGEAIVRSGDVTVARLPYVVRRRAGLTIIAQPPLTQTLGPWLGGLPAKQTKRLAREKSLIADLLAQLPSFHLMEQDLSPRFTNALPFHWAGYEARVRYTHRLDDLGDLDEVWSGFHQLARRKVRQAERHLEVRKSENIDALVDLTRRTLQRAGARPLDPALVRRVHAALVSRGRNTLLYAVDAEDRVHAAAYFVWDDRTTYYLLAGRDESLPDVGAPSRLIWEGMQEAARRGHAFDFEGSMLEPVEEFFRGFGGRPTPYLRVARRRGAGSLLATAREMRRRRGSR